jgi:cell division protein FtsI/penicillin-binding protein 2
MVKKSCCLIILLCGALALLLTGCAGREEPGPEAALAQYIRLWEQGNWSEMYQMLSAESQAQCDEETFCTRHANIAEGIGLARLSLRQVTQAEQELLYTLEFETTTVGSFTQDYSLEVAETPQGWKLDWDHCHIFPQLTAQRVVRVSRQMPRRGSILDRDNAPLATTGSAYSVGLVPGSMDEHGPGRLALLLDRQEEEIRSLLEQAWVRDDTFVPVQTLSQQDWLQLRPALTAIKGVLVREREARVYNIPDSLAQTVGYVGEIQAERLAELEKLGFRAGDIVGQAGLELVYDEVLAGRPGFTITIREGQEVVATVARREQTPGQDVRTTLDLAKIRLLDSVLGDWTGSMLLMDYTSGAILGAVSKPGFDSNLFALGITPRQYQELEALDTPFFNRAFNGVYPPGSVFKPFTALMALEQGVVDPEHAWDTPLRWQKSPDWGGYQVTRVLRPLGPVNLWDAMKWSDNVYFADLGLKVGWEAFEEYAGALGFGADIPLPLNNRKSQVRNQGRGEVLLADTSYGQGEMTATPLHMTLMYAAIARRDGTIPVPRLVETESDGIWLETGFARENLELVDRVLAYAASDQQALAWAGQETVRGKTGTSEISRNRQIAWYICYFDDLVLTVCLEGDRSISSLHAVALARECLERGIRER